MGWRLLNGFISTLWWDACAVAVAGIAACVSQSRHDRPLRDA